MPTRYPVRAGPFRTMSGLADRGPLIAHRRLKVLLRAGERGTTISRNAPLIGDWSLAEHGRGRWTSPAAVRKAVGPAACDAERRPARMSAAGLDGGADVQDAHALQALVVIGAAVIG